jgi:hypothetical protein
MANRKLIYVSPNSDYIEDNITVSTSVGAGSADSVIKTDAGGQLDNTFINFAIPATEQNTAKPVKASDLSNAGANQGAKIVGFDNTNVASYTTATKVQQAIEDAFAFAQAPGVLYTAGAGGVSKGQLVFVSAADTATVFSTITSTARAIGIAATTAAAAASFKVLSDSTVLTGVLTGATPGAVYYWTGSALSTTMPSATGTRVYEVGTAKNVTDLHVAVRYIKTNA